MSNLLNVNIDTKTLTPIIRELIREQLTQRENEERQRIKQEQALTKDTKEKPLTDSEIQELRQIIRGKRNERYMTGLPRVMPKDK